MNKPLISIIVPVFNSEKYISRCINSILEQTYGNFELIIINDGSKDKSLKICEEYQKKDRRIKVFNQENKGQAFARNVGLDNAKGEYISFIDSDDYVHSRFLEFLYNALISSDSDISMCYHKKTFFRSNVLCKKKYNEIQAITITGTEAVLRYADEDAYYFACPCNKLYKKFLFNNLRFPEGRIAEDCYLLFDVLFKSKTISIINQQLYYYYQNRNSTMHTSINFADYNIDAYKKYYCLCKQCFSENVCEDLKLPILYKIIDFLAEDYWKATLYHNISRKKEINRQYLYIKRQIIKYGGSLKFKYKLYDFNKNIYVLARAIFELLYILKTYIDDVLFFAYV